MANKTFRRELLQIFSFLCVCGLTLCLYVFCRGEQRYCVGSGIIRALNLPQKVPGSLESSHEPKAKHQFFVLRWTRKIWAPQLLSFKTSISKVYAYQNFFYSLSVYLYINPYSHCKTTNFDFFFKLLKEKFHKIICKTRLVFIYTYFDLYGI